ncbi:MAG: nucleotidyltransferase family protein [Chloroflexi bacterium]|nr:nucleotidyltransferase family protein [Chloroflexota bacterium]
MGLGENQIRIKLPMEALEAFCRRWFIVEMALFGSALRDDFGPESDIDLLVTYAPEAERSLKNLIEMSEELEAILGRKVDLVNRAVITQSRNYIRRRAILESARTIYDARSSVSA